MVACGQQFSIQFLRYQRQNDEVASNNPHQRIQVFHLVAEGCLWTCKTVG
jgi:hypothetical protein